MNGIHFHTLSTALVLAVTSTVLTGMFGLSAIEALVVCSLGALAVSVALICIACILQKNSEPLSMAFEVAKSDAAAIMAIVRNAIGR